MTSLVGKRLLHVTTVDMSLALLLGPQLRAFAEAGMEVVGVSAPGPYVRQLEAWGIRHEPLRHATRSMAVGQDVMALAELWRLGRATWSSDAHADARFEMRPSAPNTRAPPMAAAAPPQ